MTSPTRAEQVYQQLMQEDCPHPWDGQPHLKSACRRCTIEAYDAAFLTLQQETVEACAKIVEGSHAALHSAYRDQIANELRATVGGTGT